LDEVIDTASAVVRHITVPSPEAGRDSWCIWPSSVMNRTVPFGTPLTSSRTSTGASACAASVSPMPACRPAPLTVKASCTEDDSAIQLWPARMPLMMASVARSSAYRARGEGPGDRVDHLVASGLADC
jgi:hypothetical protein